MFTSYKTQILMHDNASKRFLFHPSQMLKTTNKNKSCKIE